LHHAYEDYELKLKTNKGFNDRNPNYYSFDTDELNNVRDKFKNNNKLLFLSYSIYHLMNVEEKANVAQLYYEMDKLKFTKEDIQNGKYKDFTYYKNYLNINKYSESYVNSLNNEELKLLMEYAKHTGIKKIITNDINAFKRKLINFLKTNSEYVMNKMKKIMIEYLKYHEMLESHSKFPNAKQFSKFLDGLIDKSDNLK
jgi:hypothetical protein